MDGNRRWAKNHGLSTSKGHKKGAEALINLCRVLKNYNIPLVTVYAFSTENNERPENEKKELFKMMEEYLDSDIKKLQKEKVQIKIIGDFSIFHKAMQTKIEKANKVLVHDSKFTLCIALNYGGKQEIIHALNECQKHGKSVKNIQEFLYVSQDVDLLIRTGGEQRLSNFLLWQSAYAELYFTQTLWPNFSDVELQKAIDFFVNTKRNFGA